MTRASLLALLKRWRRWLILLAIVLVVRAALPEVVRRIVISQASQALRAQVDIGDVDLELLRGGFALNDVAVRAVPAGDAAPTPPSNEPPLISWKRLAVELSWRALFDKTVRLQEVTLDSPYVGLDRLADGQLNLAALLPKSEEAAAPTPVPDATPAPGWGVGLDRIVLTNGTVQFRDFATKGSEPVSISVDKIEVTDIALQPGLYGEPAQVHVALAFDTAAVQLDAHVTMRETGMAVNADLMAKNLPLHRAHFYIPRVGWSALQGEVDAAVAYRFDTGTKNELSGTVTVHDLAVRVAQIEEPALAWKSLTVKVDPVDLVTHRVAVAEVDLDGASLLVRPQGGDLLPFLTNPSSDKPAVPAGPSPSPAPANPPTPETPWQWSVTSVDAIDTHVHVLGDAPLDVGVTLGLKNLADPEEQPAHVELALTVGKGSVNVDGALRLKSPAFVGTLRTAALSLPELAAAAGLQPKDLVQSGRLESALTIEAGLAMANTKLAANDLRVSGKLSLAEVKAKAPPPQTIDVGTRAIDLAIDELLVPGVIPGANDADKPAATDIAFRGRLSLADVQVKAPTPQDFSITTRALELALAELHVPATSTNGGDLRAKGRFALTEFQMVGADAKTFAVGTRSLDLPITELTVPNVFGGAGAATGPLRVVLGDVLLANPIARLARVAEGVVLPNFSGGTPAAPGAAPPPVAPDPQSAPPPRRIEIAVKSTQITNGDIIVTDHTVKPFFTARFTPLDMMLRDARWPEMGLNNLHLTARTGQEGTVEIFGGVQSGIGWVEVNTDKIELPPFNPYAASFSGQSIARGTLSTATKVSFGNGRYDTDTWVTLHDLDVAGGGGESLFHQQFGVPLSLALALMRDLNHNIVLGIPVEVGSGGATVDVLSVVGSALRHAIVNALASPLKLAGVFFGGDEGSAAIAPAPVRFRVGRAELAPDGDAQLDQLAALLASRAGIGVALEAIVTPSDARWVREQALRVEWAQQGVLAKLGGLPQRATRERVRKVLEARAVDEVVELSPEDAAALDAWLAERPALSPDQMQALAAARVALVEQILRDQHGIEAQRIASGAVLTEAVAGEPSVRVEIGVVVGQ